MNPQPVAPWGMLILVGIVTLLAIVGLIVVALNRRRKRDAAYYQRRLETAQKLVVEKASDKALGSYQSLIQDIDQLASPSSECVIVRARALVGMGDVERAHGHGEQAVAHYEEALKVTSIPVGALGLVAEQRVQRQDASPEAIHLYTTFVAQSDGERLPNDHVRVFLQRYFEDRLTTNDVNQWRVAESAIQALIAAKPDASWAHRCLGQIQKRLGRPAEAIVSLRRAAELDPAQPTNWLSLGALYLAHDNPDAALSAFRTAGSLTQDPPEAHVQIARICLVERKGLQSLSSETLSDLNQHLQKAADMGAIDAGLWFRLGQAEEQSGRTTHAIVATRKAQQTDPTNPRYFDSLIRLITSAGDQAEARRAAVSTAKGHPTFAPAHFLAGRLALDAGDVQDAEIFFGSAVKLTPNDERCHVGLGLALFHQNKWAEAIPWLARLKEPTVEAARALGTCYARCNRLTEAKRVHEGILEKNAQDSQAWFDLGEVAGRLDECSLAAKAFQTSATLSHDDGTRGKALLYAGVALARGEHYQEAREAYQASLQAYGANPEAQYGIGLLAMRDNDLDAAMQAFASAVEVSPTYVAGWVGQGILLERKEAFPEAAAAFRKALSIEPDSLPARIRLGVTHAKTGAWQEAHNLFLSLDVSACDKETQCWAALAQWHAGERKQALSTWKLLHTTWPDDTLIAHNLAAVLCDLADWCFRNTRYERAIVGWQQAREMGWPALDKHIAEATIQLVEQQLRAAAVSGVDHDTVSNALQVAAEANPGDCRVLHLRGLLQLASGEQVQAVQTLTHLVEAAPRCSQYQYDLALAQLAAGNGEVAAACLAQVSPLIAECLPAFEASRGYAAWLQGRKQEAFSAYRQALLGTRGERAADANAGLGGLHDALVRSFTACGRSIGRPEEVVSVLSRLPMSDAVPAVQFCLALMHADQGDLEAAIVEAGEWHITHQEKNSGLLLGTLLARQAARQLTQKETLAATSNLAKAARLAPEVPAISRALTSLSGWQALAGLQAGDVHDAVCALERQFEEQPTNWAIIHWLAILYYRSASLPVHDSAAKQPAPNPVAPSAATLEGWWRKAIPLWVTLFANDGFWSYWREQRKAEAGPEVADAAVEGIRGATQRRLLADLRDFVSVASPAKQAMGGARQSELEVLWGMESETARLMGDCLTQESLGSWSCGLHCGPLMLAHLGRLPAIQAQVAALYRALPELRGDAGRKLATYLAPYGKGAYLLDAGYPEQATEALQPYAADSQVKPLLARALLALANEAAELKNWEAALAAYKKVHSFGIDLRPHTGALVEVTVQRVRQMKEAESWDPKAACVLLEWTRKIVGSHQDLNQNLCMCYVDRAQGALNREQPDEAWKLVSTALGYAPEDHTARSYAALSLFRVGTRHLHENRLESALSSFRKMLAYDDGGEAREALAKLLFEAELWEPAIEFFRTWFAQDPSDASVRHNLAAVLHNAGLEYGRNGLWDTALQYLEQALQVEVTSETRGSLAQCYANRAFYKYQMGNHYGAKSDLAVALKYDPSNIEWRRAYYSM